MSKSNFFETPILFLVFNRFETTKRVFTEIKKIKPNRLFISCDGPRKDNLKDHDQVEKIRDYLVNSIDWDCDFNTNFYKENLGCKEAVSSGLDWFYNQVDFGIVLEDDCLPNLSFFIFCEKMLNKYKDDYRIWHIGGVCNLTNEDFIESSSYYFSNYTHIWGWATWSNRWLNYKKNITNLGLFKKASFLNNISNSYFVKQQWLHSFHSVRMNKVNTWDFQWYYCVWSNGGLSILPKINLVSNIGFGNDSTHTNNPNHFLANRPLFDFEKFEFKDPEFIRVISKYDNINENILFKQNRLLRLKSLLFYILNNIIYDKRN